MSREEVAPTDKDTYSSLRALLHSYTSARGEWLARSASDPDFARNNLESVLLMGVDLDDTLHLETETLRSRMRKTQVPDG